MWNYKEIALVNLLGGLVLVNAWLYIMNTYAY